MALKYSTEKTEPNSPGPGGVRGSHDNRPINVAPDLMEGFGLMKSFRGIIQNQLLFEGFGIMKSFWDRNKKNS